MKKREIINKLKEELKSKITSQMLMLIDKETDENVDYQLGIDANSFKIHTNIIEGKNGSYLEISYCFNRETNNNALIIIKKEYNSAREQRNGFMSDGGLDLFTQVNSYVYDLNDKLLYHSCFSDDNKHFGNKEMVFSHDALATYFYDTTPKYEEGYLVSDPKISYQPFINIWQRYLDTNVVKTFGKNPFKGDYSNISITFDNNVEDIVLLSERYGHFYKPGYQMKINDENKIISIIEQIYQSSKNTNGFDFDKFDKEFEELMFEKDTRKP